MDPVITTGQPVPAFCLPDLQGASHCLEEAAGRILVLNFWSAECPWSERCDQEIYSYLSGWSESVRWWSVACNANESPQMVSEVAAERRLPLLLHDVRQTLTELYGAQTTPHVFVVDRSGFLRYQGAINDRTFRKRQPNRFYLRDAVQALLDGRAPDPDCTVPYGCAIVRNL